MRTTNLDGGFLLCLFFNILLNLEGLIPAVILFGFHFLFGLSIWWSVFAIGLWILSIVFWMYFMRHARKAAGTPDPPKENKNPYSAGK